MITNYRQTAEIVREQLRAAQIDYAGLSQKIMPCQIHQCRATCCHDGVYLSEEEKAGLEKLITDNPSIREEAGIAEETPLFATTRGGKAWKTATRSAEETELAADYPTHFPKTRCIFLDRSGYCGIQSWSVKQGRGAWDDKPLTCWIHPLIILPKNKNRRAPQLTLVSPDNDPQRSKHYPGFASCTHCGRPDQGGIPAHIALEKELEALSILSGRDLITEIKTFNPPSP